MINIDFSKFPFKEFPYDKSHSALGEYHYLMPKGYYGGFYDPITNHQWRSMDGSWLITEMDGVKYLESNRGDVSKGHFKSVTPLLVYDLTGYLKYLSVDIIVQGSKKMSGLAFNYVSSRHYYCYVIEDSKLKVYYRLQEDFKLLKEVLFDFEALKCYKLSIVKNKMYEFYLDDKFLFSLDLEDKLGKVAILSITSAKFKDLKIDLKKEKKINKYKYLDVYKKIDLKNFGSGRQLRFGNYNGKMLFVLAQHQKRYARDSFAHISCITCFDILGNVMWQKGTPNNSFDNTMISCDLPMQIKDIDGDNLLEFIYCKDFYLHVCDLLTGNLKYKFKLPYVLNDPLFSDYPFDYLNCDGLRIVNLGNEFGFMVKDRYKNVFILDKLGNVKWRYNHKNTGHFPYVFDFDNDSLDELFIGYDLVKDGNILFSLPYNTDHTDEIIYESLKKGSEKYFLLASGNEGFNVVDKFGNIYKHIEVGHAQRISLTDFSERMICVTSFWGANNILYMFDSNLNLKKEKEFKENGILITPVYDGKRHYLLANGFLGLMDENLDIVYKFKDKSRPTLCSEVIDIDNDSIDELILWDQKKMYIYKFENKEALEKVKKYEMDSMSNYRGEYSLIE